MGTLTGGHPAGAGAQLVEGSEAGGDDPPDGAPRTAPVRPRRRWRRRVLWILGAVVVLFVAATLALFVYPPTDQPTHVDGILSFNGDDEPARESLAVSLAEKGYAPVLLFSQGASRSVTSCPKVRRVTVVCFVDVTNNTRGEARFAGAYATRHHWHSIMIVPGRAQSMRARLLTERCFPGHVVVVPATEGLKNMASDIVHEWGGLFAAVTIYRGC